MKSNKINILETNVQNREEAENYKQQIFSGNRE